MRLHEGGLAAIRGVRQGADCVSAAASPSVTAIRATSIPAQRSTGVHGAFEELTPRLAIVSVREDAGQ